MALYLKVRDNRWQFSFGSKYMVIGDVLADPATPYVAGGTVILLARDPEVKSQRGPWFATFVGQNGMTATYIPSDYPPPAGRAPSTVLNNVNLGKLQIFQAGVELVAADLSTVLTNAGQLQGMFIFQGME